jgi:hypothetical protein
MLISKATQEKNKEVELKIIKIELNKEAANKKVEG